MRMRRFLASAMEWIRPVGISAAFFLSMAYGNGAVERFHLLGPAVVVLMCGTVAFEALFLGEVSSAKIGYRPDRAYQVQSGLNHLALALTAALVLALGWGRYAEAAVVTAMLLVFAFSGANHLVSAVRGGNLKPVNLMRPLMAALLAALMIPFMIPALAA